MPCVGAVILDDDGRLLVVRRRHPPSQDLWSLPGGRVEPGESLIDAVKREVFEETGLAVSVGDVVGVVEIPAGGDVVYDVTDFAATVVGDPAVLLAGDDATDVAWVTRDDLGSLACSPGLAETLASWAVWD